MLADYLGLPKSVYILCVGTFVNRAATFLIPFLTLYLTKERGLTVEFATLAIGTFGAGSIGGALLGGHLADRVGRRPIMLTALLGGALLLRFFGRVTSPAGILVAIVVFTLVSEMYRPAASAMIADLVPPQRRPHAYGLMYVAVNLGFGVGAYLGGQLATLWFNWLFWADAATSSLFALIILFLIGEAQSRREDVPAALSDSKSDSSNISGQNDQPVLDPEKNQRTSSLEAARYILADRTFLLFCAGALLCGLVFMQAMSTFPLYLSQRGFGPDQYGKMISINGWVIAVGQLPLTLFIARFHRGWVIAAAALIFGIGFGATGFVDTLRQFQLTVVIWTIGEMMQASMMTAVVTELAPARFRARYLGVFSMCFSSANMLGAPLGGLVLAEYGGRALWSSCFVVALMAACLFVLIRNRLVATVANSD